MKIFAHLVVPIDFEGPSSRAVELAVELAKQFGSSLTLLHVYEIPIYGYSGMEMAAIDLLTPIEDAARAQLATALAEVKKAVPTAESVLRRGVAWREILSEIEQRNPDLVVMGTHGRHGVSHLLLGSVAEKIVQMAPVPVLTVPNAKATQPPPTSI